MTILAWNEQFNLGMPSVDAQHRCLVDMLNQLDEAVAIGDEPQTVLDLIAALVDYTVYHFGHEEELMRNAGYEQYDKHKRQHEQFVEKVAAEQQKAIQDPDTVSNELLEFLVEWLSGHILVSDKHMVQALGQQVSSSEAELREEQNEIMHSNLYSALRESENRFKQLSDHLPALIWLTNNKQQPIFCNQFWSATFGLPRNELSKDKWFERIDPRDRAAVEQLHAQVAREHSEQPIEYRIVRPNQEPLWILETVVPRIRKNGQFAGLMGCGMDITVRKMAEEQLEQQVAERTQELRVANQTLEVEKNQQVELNRQLKEVQSHLVQSEKMASIGQLAAGVAHEINNPLGYISSNLNTLKQYLQELLKLTDLATQLAGELPADNPLVQAFKAALQVGDIEFMKQDLPDLVGEALEGATRAKKIVQDLRDFSHLDKQERSPFNLETGIDATLNIVNNEIKFKADIVKQYAGVRPFVCMGSQINQVVMNLLINAAHAIEEFGTITIRTGEEDGWVWFEVEDTGKGIPEEIQSKIFDPFFTTKPVGKGTGLGLSLSYKIIQDHNGRIEVHSVVGEGSRFRVSLPYL